MSIQYRKRSSKLYIGIVEEIAYVDIGRIVEKDAEHYYLGSYVFLGKVTKLKRSQAVPLKSALVPHEAAKIRREHLEKEMNITLETIYEFHVAALQALNGQHNSLTSNESTLYPLSCTRGYGLFDVPEIERKKINCLYFLAENQKLRLVVRQFNIEKETAYWMDIITYERMAVTQDNKICYFVLEIVHANSRTFLDKLLPFLSREIILGTTDSIRIYPSVSSPDLTSRNSSLGEDGNDSEKKTLLQNKFFSTITKDDDGLTYGVIETRNRNAFLIYTELPENRVLDATLSVRIGRNIEISRLSSLERPQVDRNPSDDVVADDTTVKKNNQKWRKKPTFEQTRYPLRAREVISTVDQNGTDKNSKTSVAEVRKVSVVGTKRKLQETNSNSGSKSSSKENCESQNPKQSKKCCPYCDFTMLVKGNMRKHIWHNHREKLESYCAGCGLFLYNSEDERRHFSIFCQNGVLGVKNGILKRVFDVESYCVRRGIKQERDIQKLAIKGMHQHFASRLSQHLKITSQLDKFWNRPADPIGTVFPE